MGVFDKGHFTTHWIGCWTQAVEIVVPRSISVEPAAQVHVRLVGILLLVQAVGSCVPDVDFDVLDGLAGGIVSDCAVHVRHVAALVFVDDGVSEGSLGGAVAPEGAKDLKKKMLEGEKHFSLIREILQLWR